MPEPPDRPFDEGDLDPDPLVLFGRWFEEAERDAGFEANAVASRRRARTGAVGPHGPDEGLRRARNHVLHELRQPQGRRARREPARGAPFNWPGSAGRCGSRARSSGGARGVHRVCPEPLTREPAERAGVAAERAVPDALGSSGASPSSRRSTRALRSPCARTGAATGSSRRLGVLAAPPRPAPRSLQLRAGRERRAVERLAP